MILMLLEFGKSYLYHAFGGSVEISDTALGEVGAIDCVTIHYPCSSSSDEFPAW